MKERGIFKRCDCPCWDRCNHPWQLRFRGQRASAKEFTKREIESRAAAQAALDEFRVAVRNGTHKAGRKQCDVSLSFCVFLDDYEEDRERRGLRSASDPYKIAILRERFQGYTLKQVADSPEPIQRLLSGLADRSPATRNRYRALFSAALRWAKKRKLITETPFDRGEFPMERENNTRKRVLLPEEQTRLIGAMANDADLRDAFEVSLDTGLRRGALFALIATDIDSLRA